MSKRIYANKTGEYTAGFPNCDDIGWYAEVSDEEVSRLMSERQIEYVNGNYFSASYKDNGGGLYANPGVTLKTIAKAVFIIGAVASLILAIVLGRSVDLWTGESTLNIGLFIGILLGGVLVSYLTGLGLAALGDIAKNLNEINRKIK